MNNAKVFEDWMYSNLNAFYFCVKYFELKNNFNEK